ncbi:MAG: transglutaminase-like domain-containing protein [Candidatus Acidiferrales bacterium]
MKRTVFSALALVAIIFVTSVQSAPRKAVKLTASSSRTFEFTYVVHVPVLPSGSHTMRIWLPLPETGAHQQITGLHIASPIPYRIARESRYRNLSAYFNFNSRSARAPFDIKLTFRARRYEYKVALPSGDPASSPRPFPPDVARFLLPDRLVPINGVIAELSREQTAGISDPLAKARKLYDYVISTMHYDHAGTGWGRGDAVFACTAHHGNCTDFHSLFIGMVRAAGIPARFEIGFPLPLDQHEGKISGYHCWAEFYIQGTGWVPVDASEAWQMPPRHNYFFGAVDPSRVRFSRGRDLILNPSQAGAPLNYFVYPYAELDGKRFAHLGHDFSFRDLTPEQNHSRAK